MKWLFSISLFTFLAPPSATATGRDQILPEQQFCFDVLRFVRRSAHDREKNIRMDGPGVVAELHTALFEPSIRSGHRPGNELTEEFRVHPEKASTIAGLPDNELRQFAVQVELTGAKLYFDPKLKSPGVEMTADSELRLIIPKEGLTRLDQAHELRHLVDVFDWAKKLKAADPNLSDKEALVRSFAYLSTPKGIEWLELRAIRAEFEEHILNSRLHASIKNAAAFADELLKTSNYPESEALKRVVYLRENRLHLEFKERMPAKAEQLLALEVDREFNGLVAEISRNLIRRYLADRKELADMHEMRARERDRVSQRMAAQAHRKAAADMRVIPTNFDNLFNRTWADPNRWAQIAPIADDVYLAQRFGVLDMVKGPRRPMTSEEIAKRWKDMRPDGQGTADTAMLVRNGKDPTAPLQLYFVRTNSVKTDPDATIKVAVRQRGRDAEKIISEALKRLEAAAEAGAKFESAGTATELRFGGNSATQLVGWIALPPSGAETVWR